MNVWIVGNVLPPPTWHLNFFDPPFVALFLGFNLLVDSIVLLACILIFQASRVTGIKAPIIFLRAILPVWVLGFVADFIASIPLWAINRSDYLHNALPLDFLVILDSPTSHPGALATVLVLIAVAGALIYVFNYHISFYFIKDLQLKKKMALSLAVVTAPWFMLVSWHWLYRLIMHGVW